MRSLLVALLCLVLSSGAIAETFLFEDLRQGDRVEWDGDRFIVYSTTGIGQVTIRPNGDWPARVKVRFCYAEGRGMERIEGLALSTQTLAIQGNFRHDKAMPLTFVTSGQHEVAGTLDVEFVLVEDGLELTLPRNFACHAEYLKVSWIDVYR